MTLASPRRTALCAFTCALATLARVAAADPPLPPLPLPAVPPPEAAKPAPLPAAAPAPKPPASAVTPPRAAPAPPGLAWMAQGAPPTGSLPPGYAPPGYAPPGYATPGAVPPGYATPGYAPPGYAPPGDPASGYYPSPYAMAPRSSYILPESLPRQRRDTGLFVGGVLAVAGGMAAALVGAYLVSSAAGAIDIYCDTPSFPCAHKTDAVRLTGGAIMMAGGAALGIAGIPMWLVGSQYVTVPRGEKKPAFLPEVRVGAGSASATLRF